MAETTTTTTSLASLDKMLEKFGVVTVMDVELYAAKRHAKAVEVDETLPSGGKATVSYSIGEWDAVGTLYDTANSKVQTPLVYLDTLKITNINAEGPNKTATGGMAADTLIKYGKKFTIEMQDALGRYGVLTNLYGANVSGEKDILAITDKFPGEMTLVGTTFFIDQATGAKQPLKIVVPIFLGNGIFNLSQDAEGDVSTFDLNGDILRFEKDAEGNIKDGKYESGGDNSFYFLCTEAGYKKIYTNGYREAFDKKAA